MADAIIILVVVIILIFALKGSIKHFKGEGACCGGGSGSVKTKKQKRRRLMDRWSDGAQSVFQACTARTASTA